MAIDIEHGDKNDHDTLKGAGRSCVFKKLAQSEKACITGEPSAKGVNQG